VSVTTVFFLGWLGWFSGLCGLIGIERLLELARWEALERRAVARGGQIVPERAFGRVAFLHGAGWRTAPVEARSRTDRSRPSPSAWLTPALATESP
jgi:hypothetical protein